MYDVERELKIISYDKKLFEEHYDSSDFDDGGQRERKKKRKSKMNRIIEKISSIPRLTRRSRSPHHRELSPCHEQRSHYSPNRSRKSSPMAFRQANGRSFPIHAYYIDKNSEERKERKSHGSYKINQDNNELRNAYCRNYANDSYNTNRKRWTFSPHSCSYEDYYDIHGKERYNFSNYERDPIQSTNVWPLHKIMPSVISALGRFGSKLNINTKSKHGAHHKHGTNKAEIRQGNGTILYCSKCKTVKLVNGQTDFSKTHLYEKTKCVQCGKTYSILSPENAKIILGIRSQSSLTSASESEELDERERKKIEKRAKQKIKKYLHHHAQEDNSQQYPSHNTNTVSANGHRPQMSSHFIYSLFENLLCKDEMTDAPSARGETVGTQLRDEIMEYQIRYPEKPCTKKKRINNTRKISVCSLSGSQPPSKRSLSCRCNCKNKKNMTNSQTSPLVIDLPPPACSNRCSKSVSRCNCCMRGLSRRQKSALKKQCCHRNKLKKHKSCSKVNAKCKCTDPSCLSHEISSRKKGIGSRRIVCQDLNDAIINKNGNVPSNRSLPGTPQPLAKLKCYCSGNCNTKESQKSNQRGGRRGIKARSARSNTPNQRMERGTGPCPHISSGGVADGDTCPRTGSGTCIQKNSLQDLTCPRRSTGKGQRQGLATERIQGQNPCGLSSSDVSLNKEIGNTSSRTATSSPHDGTCQRPHENLKEAMESKFDKKVICIHNPPCVLINGCLNLPNQARSGVSVFTATHIPDAPKTEKKLPEFFNDNLCMECAKIIEYRNLCESCVKKHKLCNHVDRKYKKIAQTGKKNRELHNYDTTASEKHNYPTKIDVYSQIISCRDKRGESFNVITSKNVCKENECYCGDTKPTQKSKVVDCKKVPGRHVKTQVTHKFDSSCNKRHQLAFPCEYQERFKQRLPNLAHNSEPPMCLKQYANYKNMLKNTMQACDETSTDLTCYCVALCQNKLNINIKEETVERSEKLVPHTSLTKSLNVKPKTDSYVQASPKKILKMFEYALDSQVDEELQSKTPMIVRNRTFDKLNTVNPELKKGDVCIQIDALYNEINLPEKNECQFTDARPEKRTLKTDDKYDVSTQVRHNKIHSPEALEMPSYRAYNSEVPIRSLNYTDFEKTNADIQVTPQNNPDLESYCVHVPVCQRKVNCNFEEENTVAVSLREPNLLHTKKKEYSVQASQKQLLTMFECDQETKQKIVQNPKTPQKTRNSQGKYMNEGNNKDKEYLFKFHIRPQCKKKNQALQEDMTVEAAPCEKNEFQHKNAEPEKSARNIAYACICKSDAAEAYNETHENGYKFRVSSGQDVLPKWSSYQEYNSEEPIRTTNYLNFTSVDSTKHTGAHITQEGYVQTTTVIEKQSNSEPQKTSKEQFIPLTAKNSVKAHANKKVDKLRCLHKPKCAMIPECVANELKSSRTSQKHKPNCTHQPVCALTPACNKKILKERETSTSANYVLDIDEEVYLISHDYPQQNTKKGHRWNNFAAKFGCRKKT